MNQLFGIQQPTRTARMVPLLAPEPQGTAPALHGAARPGFVAEAPPAAVLDSVGQPLVRRRRRLRDRLGGILAGSGLIHLAVLALLALSYPHAPGGPPEQAQPVEMLYENPGKSGMVGEPNSAPRPQMKPVPIPTPEPPTRLPPMEAPPPVPLPELPSAEALPKPLPHPRPTQDNSPLSHPMDLSFAPPRLHQRRAGSGGAIDLSLGPMVQNGQINTPYASTSSIHGVSSDYAQELGDWIRRHMYYPQDAAERGEDGPSSVKVVLDRQGHVKSIRLVNSSGSYALDDATEGMFRGATLPPIPPDMKGPTFDVDLTIDYILLRR